MDVGLEWILFMTMSNFDGVNNVVINEPLTSKVIALGKFINFL